MSLNTPVLVKGNISKNFTIGEMANPSAREPVKLILTPEMMTHLAMMQELRDEWGRPLVVSSWYRTPTFNRACGGNARSEHLIGCATDVSNVLPRDFNTLMTLWRQICEKHGRIGNLGYYNWGIHFGSRGERYGYRMFHTFDMRR